MAYVKNIFWVSVESVFVEVGSLVILFKKHLSGLNFEEDVLFRYSIDILVNNVRNDQSSKQ